MILATYDKKRRCEVCNDLTNARSNISCNICDKTIHNNCTKSALEFNQPIGSWLCENCSLDNEKRYNPFLSLTQDKYDPINLDDAEDISEISKILQNSHYYNTKTFEALANTNSKRSAEKISFLFNNIDGSASNFDNFLANISLHNHEFSVIGLAETNVQNINGDLYAITGYSGEHNETQANKSKGKGVALYIRETFVFERIDNLCTCTPNLETLFVRI